MSRQLVIHKTNTVNKALNIEVDDTGLVYCIDGFTRKDANSEDVHVLEIHFHSGAPDLGIRGITIEALLAVLIDKMELHQASKFNCRENAIALSKLEEAFQWLNYRTAGRMRRHVEGKQEK